MGAFIEGGANFLHAIGIPIKLGICLIAVLVAGFAATTLDTATRLQRYVIQEIGTTLDTKPIQNKFIATGVAVLLGGVIAAMPGIYKAPPSKVAASQPTPTKASDTTGKQSASKTGDDKKTQNPAPTTKPSTPTKQPLYGSGGMILWPLFGATNQLLAGLAFMVTVFYLWRRNKPIWFAIIPMVIMLIMPAGNALEYVPLLRNGRHRFRRLVLDDGKKLALVDFWFCYPWSPSVDDR